MSILNKFDHFFDSGKKFEDCYKCKTCSAVVYETDLENHQQWHDALLYFANTISDHVGVFSLLDYTKRL